MREVSSELEAEALKADQAVVVAQDAANVANDRANGSTNGNDEDRNILKKNSTASDIINANSAELMRPNYF